MNRVKKVGSELGKEEFVGLKPKVWEYLVNVYGGGPGVLFDSERKSFRFTKV
jgi:hypothetical protein